MLFRFSLLLVISHIPLSFLMVTNCPIKDLLLSIATGILFVNTPQMIIYAIILIHISKWINNKMNTEIYEKIMTDLEFDRDNLEEVWRQQPRLLMEYGARLARAEREVADAKLSLDAIEAKIYDIERKSLSMNGIKFNESVLEAKVRTNPQYLAKRQKLDDARLIADIYKHAVTAFTHRRDMIVQASKMAIVEIERMGAERFTVTR